MKVKHPKHSIPPSMQHIDEIKSLETDELFKMSKAVTAEIERRAKGAKGRAPKKTGSMPKGQVPPQLRKPRKWVEYVLADARQNGWESFTVHQTRKNKETGEKEEEEIVMPGSEENEDGVHVFAGSINEKTQKGKMFIQKDAMSLSKQYWTVKTQKGSRKDLYEAFDAAYDDDTESVASSSSDTVVVRMTAEEKAAQKQREKEEKAAEKQRLKEEKAAEKQREKEEKAAEKEREKEASGKQAAKPTMAKVKAAIPVVKEEKAAVAAVSTPAKEKEKKVPAAPKKKKEEEWTCPNDKMVHEWTHDGTVYLRNYDGEIWENDDGELGAWVGMWDAKKKQIDMDATEPQFE